MGCIILCRVVDSLGKASSVVCAHKLVVKTLPDLLGIRPLGVLQDLCASEQGLAHAHCCVKLVQPHRLNMMH